MTATRVVATERRQGPFLGGLAACALGLVLIVVGGIVLFANQATQVLAPADRGAVGSELSFTAEARSYAIVLLPTPGSAGFVPESVAFISCDVGLADGTTKEVRGGRQSSSLQTGAGRSIGSFKAPSGPTSVQCHWIDSRNGSGFFVAVAPERRAVRIVGTVLVVAGVVLLMAAAVLLIIGIRGRTVIRQRPAA